MMELSSFNVPPPEAYLNATFGNLFVLSLKQFQNYRAHSQYFTETWFGSSLAILFQYNQDFVLEFGWTILGAIVLTILRIVLSNFVVNILLKRKLLKPENVDRFTESLYSTIFNSITFSLAFYLEKENNFLTQSERLWIGWDLSNQIPFIVKTLYLLEVSHYFHSMFTVFFLNQWNHKDTLVLFFHHVIAILLLSISYLTKSYRLGILVIYLLDVNDVIMESCKCLYKLELCGPIWVKLLSVIRIIGFGFLVFFWFLFRLYYFPLKVIYPAVLYLSHNEVDCWFPFSFCLFGLLWLVFGLNVYWGVLILKILFHAIQDGFEEIHDIRDIKEVEENQRKKQQQNSKFKKSI